MGYVVHPEGAEVEEIVIPTGKRATELTAMYLAIVQKRLEELPDEDEEGEEKSGVRFVTTPEGEARYHRPMGEAITTDRFHNPINHPLRESAGDHSRAIQDITGLPQPQPADRPSEERMEGGDDAGSEEETSEETTQEAPSQVDPTSEGD